MAGYLIHHRSHLYEGVRADYYRNDPYVWFSPYLWSFCHLNQRPRVESGMTILWLSKADGTFVCDLVFVVGEVLPFQAARLIHENRDEELAERHFRQGMRHHPEVFRDGAKTYVADMELSYIPHPAVPLEAEINALRAIEKPWSKPLVSAWGRRTSPLRIEDILQVEQTVRARAETRITGPLGPAGSSPGEAEALR